MHVRHLSFRARPDRDHSGGFTEMVLELLTGLPASHPRLVHNLQEVAPVAVLQQGRQIAGRPDLVAVGVELTATFKAGVMLLREISCAHRVLYGLNAWARMRWGKAASSFR